MLNPNLFQKLVLPYEPLPPAAYEVARTSLLKRDFPENAILNDYSFSSRSRDHTIRINAVAFAHPTHRNPAEYASFTLYNAVNGQTDEAIVSILAESSAPFHIIHRGSNFSFWVSGIRNNELVPIPVKSDIPYDQLDEILSNYADDLKPQRIINVKQGRDTFTLPIFRDLHPLQLSLWAADVTGTLLVEHFALAVEELRHQINYPGEYLFDEVVTDIAIQLLGAIILADTGVLGNQVRLNDVSLRELINEAHSKFANYFQLDLFDIYGEAAEKAYKTLRAIRFAGFVPDMLSKIYTKAYPHEQRHQSGRFDTPLYLTRRIWQNIPVEYLPPDQRYIADMTCGWGSFLIAGYERLSSLSDTPISLREYLRGNDQDAFTAKLAGLGLLLSTSEDSWYINDEDALTWSWLRAHRPGIIVGNPPFRGNRAIKDDQKTSSKNVEKKRQQRADDFLQHAIRHLAPGGYLAMVMPRSFIAAEASPELRRELLNYCDVLELWQLPSGIFEDVNPQTMVVFAQKKSNASISHYPVRVRTIQKATLRKFQGAGTFTASELVTDQSRWYETIHKLEGSENTHIMEHKLILSEQGWQEIISRCVQLRKVADIFRGAIVGSRRRYTENSDPRHVFWLSNAKKTLKRSFHLEYESPPQTKLYPNDFEEPRLNKKHIFENTKVLVVHSPDPSWGKRAKVAIERNGYYVSGSFWVVTPLADAEKMPITHEVLAAILNWDVSNAWLIEHLTSVGIPEYAVNTVPFPKSLSEDDCKALTEAVWELEEAARANQPEPKEARQLIDTTLKAAYHLNNDTFACLRKITEWDSNPQVSLDLESDPEKANWFVSGVVDSIDAEQGTMTLWLEGFDELQTVKIVPSMPGWILRPNAAFRTKIPRQYIKQGSIDTDTIEWGMFYPQPYTYMNKEELFEKLASLLHRDEKNRVG